MLIAGTRDVVKVSHSRKMARLIPHAQLILMKGDTHTAMFVRKQQYLTESRKSPASIVKSNKQWVGTCLYQEEYKLLLINCGAVIRL